MARNALYVFLAASRRKSTDIDASSTCFTVRVPPAERSVCLKTLKNENMQMYTLFNAHVYLCIHVHVLRGVQHLQIVMLYELIDWLSVTWLSRHIHSPVMNSNIGHVSWKICTEITCLVD